MKNIYTLDQILYITTDEEIKEGDWIIDLVRNEISKANGLSNGDSYLVLDSDSFTTTNQCKKIILTTDQDLIKDGVQKIDDEFLEWFVKNPNCEEVEVRYEVLKPFQSIDKGYILRLPDTDVLEVPNLTDQKGRPMTYWGGLAEPSQDKRMYSEKEVIDLLIKMNSWPTTFEGKEDITEWFNQFKNK
jgi:hypothetical protein